MSTSEMKIGLAARRSSWIVDPDSADGYDAPYPSRLLRYDANNPKSVAERELLLTTHDPYVYASDRQRSVIQLLDWFVRTGPARALDLHGQAAAAQTLRELPEIDLFKVPGRTRLQKYVIALESAKELLEAADAEHGGPHDPEWRPRLPPMMEDIRFAVSDVLAPGRSRASLGGHVIWLGLLHSGRSSHVSPDVYTYEIELDFRRAIVERVDGASWGPKVAGEVNERSTSEEG